MAPGAIADLAPPPVQPAPETKVSDANAPSPSLFSLAGQTIAITGGGRGVGITLAIAVIEAGGHVACLDVLPEPAEKEWGIIQSLAKKSGLTATYGKCDITNETDVQTTLDEIASRETSKTAPFSGIIACAGIQQKTLALDYPVEDFNRMLNVNVTGTFLTAKHASKLFIKNNIKGSIVLIASMSGQIANRGLHCTAYNSSKAAVHQIARSMAQEVGQHGIRINTLSPGYIRTAMTDALLKEEPHLETLWMAGALLGRLGAPEDFKGPAIFLLAPGSSWMTGADLRVDGGHCASA
ncbi:putative short-chain dehydrogenase/reductase SDR, NAD(P)-binding domain superfamily [Septoria linicola]|nr:putative short-chain dehydrogenase/reductase SDR, NAD(P)-binding domain superfamily [Septoria linicola]